MQTVEMNKHCCYLQYFISENDPEIKIYSLREPKDKRVHIYKFHIRAYWMLKAFPLFFLKAK